MVEGILSRKAVAVTATDLLEENPALPVEDEGGRIGRFMRRIPTQSIKVRHPVVRIGHKNDVRGHIRLLGEELPRMLIEICGGSRVDQQNRRFLRREVRRMFDEIVNLSYAERALV